MRVETDHVVARGTEPLGHVATHPTKTHDPELHDGFPFGQNWNDALGLPGSDGGRCYPGNRTGISRCRYPLELPGASFGDTGRTSAGRLGVVNDRCARSVRSAASASSR